jgi:hypothetical protein
MNKERTIMASTPENRFNLVEEPWIPVTGEGLVSLRRVFSDGKLRAFGGNPVQKIALLKLLLAIAQSASTPENDEEWERMGLPHVRGGAHFLFPRFTPNSPFPAKPPH